MNLLHCLRIALVLLLVAAVSGCATGGLKHAEMKASIAPPEPGKGRIYFYRDRSMVGAAVRPEIRLNGEVVGRSVPGGFFYVDRAPGTYEVATETETENVSSFGLAANQVLYVKTAVSMGLLVGRVQAQLIDADQAVGELADLNYTGTSPPPVAASAQAPATSAGPPSAPGGERKPADLNDLKDLLPPQR